MVGMLMFLACISLGSAGQTYDVDDPSPRKLDPVSQSSAGLWKSVVVKKGATNWEAPSINLKSDCLWFDTELLCETEGGGDCQWMTNKCKNKVPFTHVEDFCYATPNGEKLNRKQCEWLPYWKQEAAKPSSKAVGNCKLVNGEKIECEEKDQCAAGFHDLVKKNFSFSILTFECKKECEAIADEGIREELTHRCCLECNEIKLKNERESKDVVECAGCASYMDKPLETKHMVTCEWSTEKEDHEICKHRGRCETGKAVSETRQASAQCGVVPCDPECMHDRQMHASCCEVCLEKMCEKDGDGHFLNYGNLKDNQMCRGCAPEAHPPTIVATTTSTTSTAGTAECTPFCCGAQGRYHEPEPQLGAQGRYHEPEPQLVIGKSKHHKPVIAKLNQLNFWQVASLSSGVGFLLGLCLTGCFVFLCRDKGDTSRS
jgi:hypothetical protein